MKITKLLKNPEISLVLALLAVGLLLPWHSPWIGGKSASIQRLEGYQEPEDQLLARRGAFPTPEEKKPDNSPGGSSLSISQGNTVISLSQIPKKDSGSETRTMNVVITAYSSDEWQTDGNPFLTAAGTKVERGVVANNLLPFGTEIKIPELYGDRTFVVEDRLHWSKGNYQVDIWFPITQQAVNFGVKRTHIEVIES